MTKKQERECKKIINSYRIRRGVLEDLRVFTEAEFIKITVSVAKIFDNDITEEEAKEVLNKINSYTLFRNSAPIMKFNTIDITLWDIVRYFDTDDLRFHNQIAIDYFEI